MFGKMEKWREGSGWSEIWIEFKKENFKKIATVYKMILKNSHSFKKFKN